MTLSRVSHIVYTLFFVVPEGILLDNANAYCIYTIKSMASMAVDSDIISIYMRQGTKISTIQKVSNSRFL